MKSLITSHGKLELPAFFPDATYGSIRGVDNKYINKLGLAGLVVNAYHLLKDKELWKQIVLEKKGIHNFMGFKNPIISDSGGFQVMSLIHRQPDLGKIQGDKIIFLLDGKKLTMTPESCIQTQIKIKSDIIMCLDDCTEPNVSEEKQKQSIERTIKWAGKCKKEFSKLTKSMKEKPLLFAIIQGGNNKSLRKKCAEELIKIGFDGYAFGGWPVKDKKLLKEILSYTCKLMPNNKPKYCMGVGKPEDIISCVKMGYDLFDCVIPTRDARHKRLFVFKNKKLKHGFVRIRASNNKKISEFCSCEICKNYTIKELAELFKTNKPEAIRLATKHNLEFYNELMRKMRAE